MRTKKKPEILTNYLAEGRAIPHAPEIETAVLGAIILDNSLVDGILSIIKSERYFYVEENQKVFAAILSMQRKGIPVDLMTITQELADLHLMERIDAAIYTGKITFSVVSGAHAEAHARIIVEKYILRETIAVAGAAMNAAFSPESDPFDLLDSTEQKLQDIHNVSAIRQVAKSANVIMNVMNDIDEQSQIKGNVTGVPTGNSDMDECCRGWQPGDFIVVAARPAVGKTAFALNVAYSSANAGYPVAFFSLEMPKERLMKRMLSIVSGVDFGRIQFAPLLTEDDKESLNAAANKIASLPIYWDDTPALSVPELRAKARRLKSKSDIRMIIIDYLQLMEGDSGDSKNRENEISKISREIKKLSLSLKIPIMALCQLNRTVESRTVRTYKLSDLRESGAIEQDADMVMFLHVPTSEDFKNTAESSLKTAGVFVEKNRNGKCVKVPYTFDKDRQRWTEYIHQFKEVKKPEKKHENNYNPNDWVNQ